VQQVHPTATAASESLAEMLCCHLPAGLSAHSQPRLAVVLLVLLLAVQGVHSLLLLVLRPHISVLVGAVECSCACLDLASWVPVFLAYSGAGSSAQVSSSQVGLQAWGLQREGSMMGRLGWQRMPWEALHGSTAVC
jgi:hypothetical protein